MLTPEQIDEMNAKAAELSRNIIDPLRRTGGVEELKDVFDGLLDDPAKFELFTKQCVALQYNAWCSQDSGNPFPDVMDLVVTYTKAVHHAVRMRVARQFRDDMEQSMEA